MPTEIKVENVSENVAKIIAYPFETGYAVTLAHPLQKLLSRLASSGVSALAQTSCPAASSAQPSSLLKSSEKVASVSGTCPREHAARGAEIGRAHV